MPGGVKAGGVKKSPGHRIQFVFFQAKNPVLTHERRNNITPEILTDIKNYFIAKKL